MLTTDILVTLINQHPDGMTTDDVAKTTGRKVQNVSGRLSKLAMYGLIRKQRFPIPSPTRTTTALWLPKVKVTI
jgi:predicted transcriptional regulator